MNNILFFLTPKAMCAYLYDDYTIRQALEKMESAGYAAIPILNHRGEYRGTLTEGDLLWAMKNMCYMDMRQAEARRVMEIARRKDNVPVRVTTSMHELVERASNQNFVPVVDDKDAFIGLITPKGHHPLLPGKAVPRGLIVYRQNQLHSGKSIMKKRCHLEPMVLNDSAFVIFPCTP